MQNVAEFSTPEGVVQVEVDSHAREQEGLGTAGLASRTAARAMVTFEEVVSVLRPTAQAIAAQFKGLEDPPAEVEVSFGLKITGQGSATIVSRRRREPASRHIAMEAAKLHGRLHRRLRRTDPPGTQAARRTARLIGVAVLCCCTRSTGAGC
jgi:Trypsin-co-occurring domain 1